MFERIRDWMKSIALGSFRDKKYLEYGFNVTLVGALLGHWFIRFAILMWPTGMPIADKGSAVVEANYFLLVGIIALLLIPIHFVEYHYKVNESEYGRLGSGATRLLFANLIGVSLVEVSLATGAWIALLTTAWYFIFKGNKRFAWAQAVILALYLGTAIWQHFYM